MAGHDYSQTGIYAFTVVVRGRRCCLGEIADFAFVSGPAGAVVHETWERLPARFPTIQLDAFVVMLNHIHGIVFLGADAVVAGEVAMNRDATERSDQEDLVALPFMATSGHNHIPDDSTLSRSLRPPSRDRLAPALGEIIRSLKAASTTKIGKECPPDFNWQDGYSDRIVRNDAELDWYRGYIATNPERWTMDREYSDR
jgi:putative transposase